ncbi:MAG: cytochrome o ubiquinol oxidase subunit IV [Halioglobus sp.]|nr:cytochrome o ubiquinol oxidase subunit IV [Halioglobus sp.]
MSHNHLETYARDFRSYCIGGILALALTALAFYLVVFEVLPGFERLVAISILAVAQIIVHFRYFLHISWYSHRDELQLILFTGLILFLMVGGTIWILFNLHERMM